MDYQCSGHVSLVNKNLVCSTGWTTTVSDTAPHHDVDAQVYGVCLAFFVFFVFVGFRATRPRWGIVPK